MAELKPCPFCGGEAEKKYIRRKMGCRLFNFPHITHFVYIKCKVCGTTTAVKETIENATEAWNKRTKPERPKGRWENIRCTNCGQVDFSKPNFCPNCGADMRGESE